MHRCQTLLRLVAEGDKLVCYLDQRLEPDLVRPAELGSVLRAAQIFAQSLNSAGPQTFVVGRHRREHSGQQQQKGLPPNFRPPPASGPACHPFFGWTGKP